MTTSGGHVIRACSAVICAIDVPIQVATFQGYGHKALIPISWILNRSVGTTDYSQMQQCSLLRFETEHPRITVSGAIVSSKNVQVPSCAFNAC